MNDPKHTPGPWGWFGQGNGSIYLATVHSGRRYVMGFERMGMRYAQPYFSTDKCMVPASELLKFEVGDPAITGMKSAKADESVYRYDIRGIDCADARLIAAAPELLDALKRLSALYEGIWVQGLSDSEAASMSEAWKVADALIAKVEGTSP